MRTITILAALALSLTVVALAPGAQARELVCTDTLQPGCDGWACLDTNLDGRFQGNECEPRYCTCDPEPSPW